MNKELTKEEAEEYYNKLWLENKDLIQENMGKIHSKCYALEMLLIDKDDEINELKDKILSLENERDILKSTLSDTKADIKYLLQHGENIYIRRKYIRGEIDE